MTKKSCIIGIDFGTTNCTMTYAQMPAQKNENPILNQFAILQKINSQEDGVQDSLPSFIYYPLPEEIKKDENPFVIGTFARNRGAELPDRLIASAKSWLCHPTIDRRKKNLPLQTEVEENLMSPLEACSAILLYLRKAWESSMADLPFLEQSILITVPASFDPSARQLIQEAAQMAGYPEIILLEEPQAAFYSWLYTHSANWRELLKVNDSILVVDIGGGTTDFTLIVVEEENGNLVLRRQAVGSHLLLGGDNIDLGLAHIVKQKFEEAGHVIDDWQFQSLTHRCREAKELMMGESPPSEVDITILGRGSRLIANTLTMNLAQSEVEKLILAGFLPFVEPEERSPTERRTGIQQVGLPYVQDPRMTCQLAKFLSMTGESNNSQMDNFVLPTAVLFNGGTLKAKKIREQFHSLLNSWAKKMNHAPIVELAGADYDFAVSRGAVYYGLARQGLGMRIRSGTSRSYFVGIEEAMPAVPGLSPPLQAICIVPFGLEEGQECHLNDKEFALVLGEEATFRFFSRETPSLSNGVEPSVGMVLRNWKQELTELRPIETLLNKGHLDGKTIHVKLQARVTELGVLELWCVASDDRKWKLEFDTRSKI